MKELKIISKLNVRAENLKGIIKIDDTYINSIEQRIKDYLTKYGELPIMNLKYGYIEGKGIIAVDIEVMDGIKSTWRLPSN